MAEQSKPTTVGPLFVVTEIAEKEPEKIWDKNDSDPANEARWLAYHSEHEAAMTAAEGEFIAEYQRRRALV